MSELEVVEKYKEKIAKQLGLKASLPSSALYSREYQIFRSEILPAQMTIYETLCRSAQRLFTIKVSPKLHEKLQSAIDSCHLQISPESVFAASVLYPTLMFIGGIGLFLFVLNSVFFTCWAVLAALLSFFVIQKLPEFMAQKWRLKASNQMVLCIFYVVTYMRHTSNLELALEFASDHLSPPLSLDLRKVIWDVENGKFETIKDSLEVYLTSWKSYNNEFVDSFHLIQSSLFETSDDRRLSLLDKSLDVMLEETYEKMLHYAQNLKGPITILHMLGVILPILGLVIMPLMVSFMEGIEWYHIAMLYNVALPIIVYVIGRNILSNRPTGYGDTDIAETNPELNKYGKSKIGSLSISPAIIATIVGGFFLLIAFSPLLLHKINPNFELDLWGLELQGYRQGVKNSALMGPYGIGASMLSLFFPLALGLGFGLYYHLKSKNVMKIRDDAKKLEEEFASALFQLGNRLGDGIPAEIAFPKVADVMEDTVSGRFFKLVSSNMAKLGMSVKEAIFNPQNGALTVFPSAIIQSSMKVLIESIKKGPLIAAQALLNVARYVKEIHKVNERLKDLMTDIVSDMKGQIAFLTPMIAGIVIGITSMITFILGSLSTQIGTLGAQNPSEYIGSLSSFFGDSIPTYYFQLVVGIYVVQIVFILTILSNGIENGADKLQERYLLGSNLMRSTIIYCLIAGGVMLAFNIVALRIIAGTLLLAG